MHFRPVYKNMKSGGGCDKEKTTQVIIIILTRRSQWLFHMGRKKKLLQVTRLRQLIGQVIRAYDIVDILLSIFIEYPVP